MPDFDGTGPLKRGRIIGRGRGPCRKPARADPAPKKEETDPEKEPALT
jgi:hypothetical protein